MTSKKSPEDRPDASMEDESADRPRSTLELDQVRAAARSVRNGDTQRKRQDSGELAVLSVVEGPQAGQQVRLGEETVIGRGEEATLLLHEGDVSRMHARIVRSQEGAYVVEDLQSRNGTWINDEPITRHGLVSGDRIAIGSAVLLFTRRSEQEEELLEAQKLESLGRLAGGVAHDFNNLLAVILGNVQLVQSLSAELQASNPLVADCLHDVVSASRQARDLVQQLLGFARRGHWEEAPTDVSQLMEEVSGIVRRTFDRRIRVEAEIEPGLVVIGDRSQLFQMGMNLCLNARDAIQGSGRIQLRARRIEDAEEPLLAVRGPTVLMEVSDDGSGMDAETQQRIFEPFFTTKRSGRGTGLGLSVVYGIVVRHGGRIWVESALEQGTRFHMALPAADPESLHRETELPTMSPDSARRKKHKLKRVLIVDDEALVRRSVARMVEQLGYVVDTASDGAQALERYLEIADDLSLVLLDLIMPGMDGEHTLEELQRLQPDLPVVVMSGYQSDSAAEDLKAAGAVGFLAKPFTLEQLHAAFSLVQAGIHA